MRSWRSFALGLILALSCIGTYADEPEWGWRFDQASIDGHQVVPFAGELRGAIAGTVSLTQQPPFALRFNGQNNVMRCGDLADAGLPAPQLTVESWVRIDKPREWGGIVSALQDNGEFERGWLLGYRNSRFTFAVASAGKGRLTYLSVNDDFAVESWYYVAGVYDGRSMKLYVDGELAVTSDEQSGAILYPPSAPFEIGAYHDNDEFYPLEGQIAEVAIHKVALPPAQIKQNFERHQPRFPGILPTIPEVRGWPTYLRDNARTGYSQETLQLPLRPRWIHQTKYGVAPAWPAPAKQDFWNKKHDLPARVVYDRALHPVSDGQRLYFGSSADDGVHCLDLATGQELWTYITEGPVRFAPTLDDGRLLVGSDDGHVYCLDTTSGQLAWKRRLPAQDRRIPGNGRIISSWPVRTGVFLEDGHVRCSAGLFPSQGVFQYVLDAKTGDILASGPLPFSPQGYLTRRGASVVVPQGRAPITKLTEASPAGKFPASPDPGATNGPWFARIRTSEFWILGAMNRVEAVRVKDARSVWHHDVDGTVLGLAFVNGCLLASTDKGTIACFSARDAGPVAAVGDPVVDAPSPPPTGSAWGDYLRQLPVTYGYCLVVGDERELAVEIAGATNLSVVMAVADAGRCQELRRWLYDNGWSRRIRVHQTAASTLPYGAMLFNLIVSPAKVPPDEIARLLRPHGGVAILPSATPLSLGSEYTVANVEQVGTVVVRGKLPGAGEWTHLYANPSNVSCSDDTLVKTDLALQWFGRPGPEQLIDRHHRTVSPLYCGGRLFVPGDNRVYGVDAYNGTVLWDREVPNSRRVAAMRDCGSMAATEDYLYVASAGTCVGLNAGTGRPELTFDVPSSSTGELRHWGYTAVVDNTLFGSSTRVGASRNQHSRQQIRETYYDFVPLVVSDAVFAYDRHSQQQEWHYQAERGAIVNPTITIAGGRIYWIESHDASTLSQSSGRVKLTKLVGQGADLVAVDAETGKTAWRTAVDLTAIQHHLYLLHAQGCLFAVGTRNQKAGSKNYVWYDAYAFDSQDGSLLWTQTQSQHQEANGDHGEQDHHPAIVGDTLFVEPYAYDLLTGKPRERWKMAREGHGCGSISAAASVCFFRAGNPTMCDLATGVKKKVTQVSRPGCWINMIPAGGLLLIPEASSGCTCNYSIQASMAFAPVE